MSCKHDIDPSDMSASNLMGEKVSGEPNGEKIDPRLSESNDKKSIEPRSVGVDRLLTLGSLARQ